jgi:hypothetical protein
LQEGADFRRRQGNGGRLAIEGLQATNDADGVVNHVEHGLGDAVDFGVGMSPKQFGAAQQGR